MELFATWDALSSDGVLGTLIEILGSAGDWAGAAATLIGLVS